MIKKSIKTKTLVNSWQKKKNKIKHDKSHILKTSMKVLLNHNFK